MGLQGHSTHPISSSPPAQSDLPSQTCLPFTQVPSGQNQPSAEVLSAEVVHWKPQPISSEPSMQLASPSHASARRGATPR